MEKNTDEIDLLELSQNIMVKIYHYYQRRWKLLGIFILIGLLIGIGLFYKDKNKFENSIIGTSYIINPTLIVNIINSLDEINSNDKETAMKLLGLTPEEAKAFLGIKADTIQTLKTIDNNILLTTLKIKIRFKADMNFSSFSERLCHYINSNKFVAKELELEKQKSMGIVKKQEEEIKRLDSLQEKILSSKVGTSNSQAGNLLILNDKANSFFHNDIVNLETNKQTELKKISRLTGLEIIDEKMGTKIKEVSLTGIAIKMSVIFFGIGFFISLILEFKRKVKLIEQSKK